MGDLLLHIGFHKTATTWLQQAYFPEHPGIAFPFGRAELSEAVVRPHPFTFDPQATREALMPAIEQGWDDGKTVVLSNERFTGNPASGGIDALDIADRLHAMFPEAKVWMAVREQTAMTTSYYNQFIKQGGTCTVEQFLAGNPTHKRIPYFTLEYFQYLPLIRYWERLYGDRLKVTLFEDFKADAEAVLDGIGEFAGFAHQEVADVRRGVNVSLADRSIRILRVLNGLLPHAAAHAHFRPLVRLPGNYTFSKLLARSERMFGKGRRVLKNRIREGIGDYYDEHNRALADHLGVDLAAKGYRVG